MFEDLENTNQRLKYLTGLFDSDNIFIKSIEYLSPTTVRENSIVSPNSLGDTTVLLYGFESVKGIQLHLDEVQNIAIDFEYEVCFSVIYNEHNDTYSVGFNNVSEPIICKHFRFEIIP